jgi:hypothetical protein
MKDLKFICEEWRSIPEFIGYEVSSLGRVRSIDRVCGNRPGITKGRLLTPFINRRGYLEVIIRKNSKSTAKIVHRLVAKTFLSNFENKPQVNHIDGNKQNNSLENLEWVTNSQNQKHAYLLGLQPSRAGEMNNNTTLKNRDVGNLKEIYNSGKTASEVSKITGVSIQIIRSIIYGRTWKTDFTSLLRRDDRSNKSKESIEKMICTKQSKGIFGVTVVQLSKDGKELNSFRSINDASRKTGVARKSIEAVVHDKQFYSKDGSKSWKMTDAGGYIWKKL